MLNKKLLTSLFLLTVITGCDSDDDKSKDTSPSLVGVWNSSCIIDDSYPEDEESSMYTYEFTETEVTLEETIYSDFSCEQQLVKLIISGTYVVGENVTTPSGIDATELDLILTNASNSFGLEYDDYNFTALDLFVIEGTYLYLGDKSESEVDDESETFIRPEDIDYSSALELQE
jgi:hypothetical protein